MRALIRIGLIVALLPAAALAAKSPPKCLLNLEKLNLEDEVAGLTLGNTHEVYEGKGKLLRGHEPAKDAKQLTDIGVTDVVIFKHDNKGEVAKEIEDLKKLGIPEERITAIDMPWKDIEDMKDPCRKTLQAMNAMLAVAATPGRVGYFHCSAGQDRTGMLAGLLRMITAGWTAEKAFVSEMCAHGYGFGDTTRPANVSKAVETNLTPIFLQIASQIEGQGLALTSKLSPSLCTSKPKTELDSSRFKCK